MCSGAQKTYECIGRYVYRCIMNRQDAENIQAVIQGCIKELNVLLKASQHSIDKSEFKTLKSNVAQAMGMLIDVEEFSVYNEYPELRPFQLKGKG